MNIEAISALVNVIAERKKNPVENSYTCKLFGKGSSLITKKLGEETAEFIHAYLTEDAKRTASEAADIIYHLLVALEDKGADFSLVLAELASRAGVSGLDEKASRREK